MSTAIISHNNYSKAHICSCLSRLSTICRHSTVTVFNGRRQTGEQFVQSVLSLANGLLQLGLRPGHIVAISAFNSDWYLEWILAIAYVGGITAPLNYRWSASEARLALEVVMPVMLVTDNSCSWHSESQIDVQISLRWHVLMSSSCSTADRKENDLTTELLKKPSMSSLALSYCWAPEDIAIICFTSGTTGKPKGVTINHTALVVQSLAKLTIVGYDNDDVYLHTAPLCHIGGISSAMAMLMAGGCHVLIPKFDAITALEAIECNHVSSFITVPAMMVDLLSSIRLRRSWRGGNYVRKILNGGGNLVVDLVRDTGIFFPRAKVLSAYGMTETCSSLTFITLHDPTSKNSAEHSVQCMGGLIVGKAAPHVEIMISKEDSSSDMGRILTRGPNVMNRYWGEILSTTSCPNKEDWFDTGDVGKIDHRGNLWLIGRKNGRIKSGGENVYPEEVEAILSQHPGISCVAVVGSPHPRLGEVVVACIQIKENWRWIQNTYDSDENRELYYLSGGILKRFCTLKKLSGFKVPKVFIRWTKPFPCTSTGKLKRDQVGQEATRHLQLLSSNL